MAARFLLALAFAAVTTFGLFWAMQALISGSYELKEGRANPKVEFVRLRRDRAPETKEREPPKREKPEQAPPPPQMSMAQNINPSEAVGDIMPVAGAAAAEIEQATSLGAGGSDRDVVPLVRVDPEYPQRARQRGIEGWVDLEFTIGPAGTVENARVIGSSPPTVFDQAALRAVQRWRYNPRVEHGVAVSRSGVRVRLRFELSGS
jgi:protein TonB